MAGRTPCGDAKRSITPPHGGGFGVHLNARETLRSGPRPSLAPRLGCRQRDPTACQVRPPSGHTPEPCASAKSSTASKSRPTSTSHLKPDAAEGGPQPDFSRKTSSRFCFPRERDRGLSLTGSLNCRKPTGCCGCKPPSRGSGDRRDLAGARTSSSVTPKSSPSTARGNRTSYPERHPALVGHGVCPTPYVLGSVCGRGERELPGWRSNTKSTDLLGNYSETMADIAKYIFDIFDGHGKALRVLSAADGCADDSLQEIQAKYVPTSVMLAHSFATSKGDWHHGRICVQILGGDMRNTQCPHWQAQESPWQLPSWLEQRFVALDNTLDFSEQLIDSGQCRKDHRFDAVLIRQGLCYCDDPSRFSTAWPCEVVLSCKKETFACGVYRLEPALHHDRPAYRKEPLILQWSPTRGEWEVVDADGGAWAYAKADVGHPVLARGPWTIWDGKVHVSESSFSCELTEYGSPPWQRPVTQRVSCCGIPGDMNSVLRLLHRVVKVLDTRQPNSFGLLHGAWTNGARVEAEELHQQLEEAVKAFNRQRAGPHVAAVLRRTAASHEHYWLHCDGIIVFQPRSRADPYMVYGPHAHFRPSLSFHNPLPLQEVF